MLKTNNTRICGWEAAVRGMRNPMNSWDKSASCFKKSGGCEGESCSACGLFPCCESYVGDNDLALMKSLAKAGSDHRKYMRMIVVYVDVTAPLYWWKEACTYKVGTVMNSCSTMHTIHKRDLTMDDFSHEHVDGSVWEDALHSTVNALNYARNEYLSINHKDFWWAMIQLLPSSYNQRRTWMLNYEVLRNIYHARKNHKLDEWHQFCDWIETLPYSELITGGDE